jgi:hypothetical protein
MADCGSCVNCYFDESMRILRCSVDDKPVARAKNCVNRGGYKRHPDGRGRIFSPKQEKKTQKIEKTLEQVPIPKNTVMLQKRANGVIM